MAFWFGLSNILFMDETGFYQRQSYQRSWSPVGKPCYAKIEANKGKRLNLIGAMSMAEFKLIAPVTFEGGCKRDTVENLNCVHHNIGLTIYLISFYQSAKFCSMVCQ